jgi:hypothetical protein
MHGARPVGERTLLDQSVGWIDQDTEPAGDQLAGDGAGLEVVRLAGRPARRGIGGWARGAPRAGEGMYVRGVPCRSRSRESRSRGVGGGGQPSKHRSGSVPSAGRRSVGVRSVRTARARRKGMGEPPPLVLLCFRRSFWRAERISRRERCRSLTTGVRMAELVRKFRDSGAECANITGKKCAKIAVPSESIVSFLLRGLRCSSCCSRI